MVDRFWDLVRVAIAVAVVSALVGLYLSYYLNVASGASIVLIETLCFGLALALSPKRAGLIRRRRPIPVTSR
jgi:manganese/iron transport system permease protein